MNRFLYFHTTLAAVNSETLSEAGLLHPFKAADGVFLAPHVVEIERGPGGVPGKLFALGREDLEYRDDGSQVWMLAMGGHWIGYQRYHEPNPDDLMRTVGLRGYETTLADGKKWRVPVLRKWAGDCFVSPLPKRLSPVRNESGMMTITPMVTKEFEPLDALGAQILNAFLTEQAWPLEMLFKACVALLAANYRVGEDECALLGLFDESAALRVLSLSIDVPALEADSRRKCDQGLVLVTEASATNEAGE
ncbi:MAG: hypothetical protein WCT04_24360 [Planctomycetota bacterium]